MKTQINLAVGKKTVSSNRKSVVVSSAIFIVSFLLAGGILLYFQQLRSHLLKIEDEKSQIQQQLNTGLTQKKADFFVLKDRLGTIQKILQTRMDLNSKINAITRILPNSITIDSISATSSDVTLSFISTDLLAINDLLEERIKAFPQSQANGVKKIDLTSFRIDNKTVAYAFSLKFSF